MLLNDPTYVEAAARAGRGNPGRRPAALPTQKVAWAFQPALQRDAERIGAADAARGLTTSSSPATAKARRDAERSSQSRLRPDSTTKPEDRAELAAWTHVARVLLNLHETITRP